MSVDATARPSPAAPHFLLAPGESMRMLVDSSDAAGIYTQPDGASGSVASVTIRTLIPASLAAR